MGNIKSLLVVLAIGYGLYIFGAKGNFTLIPPSEKAVMQAVAADKMQRFRDYDVTLQKKCTRVGGGMVQDGVYSCDIEVVHKQNAAQLRTEHIILVKQKNRWVLR